MPSPTLAGRFWAKVIRSDEGCWDWSGSKDRHGYGRISLGGKRGPIWEAHRVSWLLHFGEAQAGLEVCHRCDNPACTRPDHLFLGTHGDNMRDAVAKGRNAPPPLHVGTDAAKAKLTPELVTEMRRRRAAGESTANLAKAYGINVSSAKRIIARRYWRAVP